jgi:hypothetical protein
MANEALSAEELQPSPMVEALIQQLEKLKAENEQLRQIALWNAETLKLFVASRLG